MRICQEKIFRIEKMLRKDIHQKRPSILCEKDGGPTDLQASVLDGTNVATNLKV